MWAILSKNRDAGLLVLRIWLGAVFLWVHGVPMLFKGDVVKTWQTVGEAIQHWGIGWPPPKFWGFLAMLTETGGIVLFIAGLLFRPSCLLLAIVMAVAATSHFAAEKTVELGFHKGAYAIELGIIFFCMIFIGPGKYSIDRE